MRSHSVAWPWSTDTAVVGRREGNLPSNSLPTDESLCHGSRDKLFRNVWTERVLSGGICSDSPLKPGSQPFLLEPTTQLTQPEGEPEGRLRVRVIAAASRGEGQRFTRRIERPDISLPHCEVSFRTGDIESELPGRAAEEHRQTSSATLSRPDTPTAYADEADAFLCWEGGAGAKCDFTVAPGVFAAGQRCSVRIRLVDVGVADIDLSAAPYNGTKRWRLKQWVDLRDSQRALTASVHLDINWLTAADVAEELRREAEAMAADQQRIAAEEAAVQQRIAAEQVAERERFAAKDAAERERIAAEVAAEQERMIAERAASEAVEQERIAAQEAAERERVVAEEAAEHAARQAAERERVFAEEAAAQAALRRKEEEEEAAKAAVYEVSVVDRHSQTSPADLLSSDDQMVFIQYAFQCAMTLICVWTTIDRVAAAIMQGGD